VRPTFVAETAQSGFKGAKARGLGRLVFPRSHLLYRRHRIAPFVPALSDKAAGSVCSVWVMHRRAQHVLTESACPRAADPIEAYAADTQTSEEKAACLPATFSR
jgi:hypothetical protein